MNMVSVVSSMNATVCVVSVINVNFIYKCVQLLLNKYQPGPTGFQIRDWVSVLI